MEFKHFKGGFIMGKLRMMSMVFTCLFAGGVAVSAGVEFWGVDAGVDVWVSFGGAGESGYRRYGGFGVGASV